MLRSIGILLASCVAAMGSIVAHAATTTVQVLATDPPGENVTLARNQNFYLRLHYQSRQPVNIWARPYFEGKPANAGSNPSSTYPAGSGEAIGWFFFMQPGDQVDEVRISAGDGSPNGTRVIATYPVRISGGDRTAGARSKPEWVTRLKARDAAVQRANYEQRMNTPPSAGDIALFSGFMLLMLGIGVCGFAGPAWGIWRWRGGWRLAAAVPAAMMGFVVLRLMFDTSRDPTSHNLWPFEILQVGALSVGIILVLMVARKITGAARP